MTPSVLAAPNPASLRKALAWSPLPAAEVSWKLAAGLALAAIIAWFAPFDVAFDAITLGSAPLRAVAIVAIALTGLAFGARIGLGLEPRGLRRPILTPLLFAAVVGAGCALTDWVLRRALHQDFETVMTTTPLALRLAGYMLRAFNDNILYRLFLSSVLIWAIGLAWKTPDGRPATGAHWAGFILAQVFNIWINVTCRAPLTPLALLHDAVRYVVPGVVWGWLYWRRGFQSNEIACTTVHLFFQPLIGLLLKLG